MSDATNLLDSLVAGTSATIPLRVVTATAIAATPDVATLRCIDGREAYMPVTEFYPGKLWEMGGTYTLLQITEGNRPQLSAIRGDLIIALLEGLSPEVRSGAVRVMGVVRAPGVRAKVAVAATSTGVDAVAACLGRQANRVRVLGQYLCGERVDVVSWHADPVAYLRNALAPAAVTDIRIDGEKAYAQAPLHQMSAAVGGAGLNSSLAGALTGFHVVIENV